MSKRQLRKLEHAPETLTASLRRRHLKTSGHKAEKMRRNTKPQLDDLSHGTQMQRGFRKDGKSVMFVDAGHERGYHYPGKTKLHYVPKRHLSLHPPKALREQLELKKEKRTSPSAPTVAEIAQIPPQLPEPERKSDDDDDDDDDNSREFNDCVNMAMSRLTSYMDISLSKHEKTQIMVVLNSLPDFN